MESCFGQKITQLHLTLKLKYLKNKDLFEVSDSESKLIIKRKHYVIWHAKGIKSRKPIVSVKKPGIIRSRAATAIDAPEIIS